VTGKFGQYDYGYAINMAKYGNPSPPDYPLNNVNTSVLLFYGLEDTLVVPKVAF